MGISHMEHLRKLLSNPLSEVKTKNPIKIEDAFYNIAKHLFNEYCIKNDTKIFRFAEVEFYYYKKDEWDEDWTKVTYPRNKNAGELFFHYSGVDICFQCHINENDNNNVEFGGILIRSLVEVDDNGRLLKLHAGPQYCANLILNTSREQFPKLTKATEFGCDLQRTIRFGIEKSEREREEKDGFNLCFYINHFESDLLNWNETSKRIDWNIKENKYKESKRNYARDRFNNLK